MVRIGAMVGSTVRKRVGAGVGVAAGAGVGDAVGGAVVGAGVGTGRRRYNGVPSSSVATYFRVRELGSLECLKRVPNRQENDCITISNTVVIVWACGIGSWMRNVARGVSGFGRLWRFPRLRSSTFVPEALLKKKP